MFLTELLGLMRSLSLRLSCCWICVCKCALVKTWLAFVKRECSFDPLTILESCITVLESHAAFSFFFIDFLRVAVVTGGN